jgi:phosphoribosylglycinamide formyltransferase
MAATTASAARDGAQQVCRVVVMASGNGSNFQALIDGVADQRIPNAAIVRLVLQQG